MRLSLCDETVEDGRMTAIESPRYEPAQLDEVLSRLGDLVEAPVGARIQERGWANHPKSFLQGVIAHISSTADDGVRVFVYEAGGQTVESSGGGGIPPSPPASSHKTQW